MKLKTLLPDRAAFRIERLASGDDRTVRWNYEETFHDRDVVARTVALVRERLPDGLKIGTSKDGRTVRMSGVSDYRTVASMITGEFIGWSALADMTLRDLIGMVFVAMPVRAELPPELAAALDKPLDASEYLRAESAKAAAALEEGRRSTRRPRRA